jgi:hypothetical protein
MSVPYQIDYATNEVGTRISTIAENLRSLQALGIHHQYIDHALDLLDQAGKLNQKVYDVCKEIFDGRTAPQGELSLNSSKEAQTIAPSDVSDVSSVLGTGVEVAGLSPLTGEALHDALVGKSGGDRYLVGGFDAELSRAYVSAYGVGGEHYNPSYNQLARLTTQQLADLQASYPTPRAWLAQHGANVETIAATWPEALALAGRA